MIDDPFPPRAGRLAVREHNLARVLGEVRRQPGRSRAAIAVSSGLTRATVSSLVETLVDWGFVAESGRTAPAGRPGAGRPGTALTVAADGAAGLGIEVNVDHLAACLVDLSGTVRVHRTQVGDQRGRTPEDVLASAARLAAAVLAEGAGHPQLRVVGAQVAVPGLVGADGSLVLAPNLGWSDVDVRGLLRREPALAGLPTGVENEANAAATAELDADTSVNPSFLHVSGEIGVGAALVLDGAILRGTHGWSGELGHMSVDPDGPPCTCGANGCLEQFAGQDAILRTALPPSSSSPTVDEVVARAAAGEQTTIDALASAGTALGIALASAVNLLDVTTVVLGGIFRPLYPWIQPSVAHEVDRRVVSRRWTPSTVRPSTRGTDGATVGAATSVVRAVRDDPAAWAPTPR